MHQAQRSCFGNRLGVRSAGTPVPFRHRMWPGDGVPMPVTRVRSAPAKAPQHLILAPSADSKAPPETECLLVLAPGFGLGPQDFKATAEAAQAHAPHVRLWAACMDLDYMGLNAKVMQQHPDAKPQELGALLNTTGVLDQTLNDVKDAAAAAGFKPRTTVGWGRCTNLYLCAQSAAGVTFATAAFKSVAGLILLASTIDGRYSYSKQASLEDWGRPIMLLGGELDGQMRWPWLAGLAADAAVLAQKAGPLFAAAHQPFVLVPGANHAQTSNAPQPNFARGDIVAQADQAAAVDAFGKAIGTLLTCHEGADRSTRQAATDQLLVMVRETAESVGPYFMASGMGDLGAAWVTGRQGGPEATVSLESPDTTHHSHPPSHQSTSTQQPLLQGTRREAGQGISAALHPGAVQKAERFVAAAQLKLASTLPKEVLSKLRVVVQTHTEVEALLFNQPRVTEQADGSVVVVVHALLAFSNLVRPGAKLPSCRPTAPEYWLKLKRPQAVAEELGLSGTFADGVTGAALNQGALDAALAAVSPATVQRYKQHGWQLTFGEDVKTADINAEKFIREGTMAFDPRQYEQQEQHKGLGRMIVQSPVLTSSSISETKQQAQGKQGPQAAAMVAAADDPYMHRFLGNWYTKVMSVAQAMEWVMLDSLRSDNTWA